MVGELNRLKPANGPNLNCNRGWLKKNISYDSKMLKPNLWQLVKTNRPRDQHEVCDELAEARGHKVLRLPLYHSELNPIELIWAQLKGYITSKNTTYSLKAVRELQHEAFASISVDWWRECCRHVIDVEASVWEFDNMQESVRSVVVTDSTDSESSDSSSSMMDSWPGMAEEF